MPLRPEVAPPDSPAKVEDGPRREAKGTGAFLGPDRRFQRKRIMVAGEGRDRGLAVAEVYGAEIEFVRRCHADRIAKP